MAQICISEQFIEPKFIPELGEDGLTAEEIAISLQVPLNAIHKKLSRGKWLSGEIKDWRITTYVFQQEIQEVAGHVYKKETKSFLLNVRAAKAFVARYASKIGDAYLNFLFDCEAAIFAKAKKAFDHKLKFASRKNTIAVPVYATNLFGETEVVRFDKVKMSLLNPLEQCQATLAHLELINEGISRRRKREHQILQNEIYKQRTIEIKSSNPSS